MSNSKTTTKYLLIFAGLSIAVLFLIPMIFSGMGNSSMPSPVVTPPPVPYTQTTSPSNEPSPEFKLLNEKLIGKGTSVCDILKTIDTRKRENLQAALKKFPNDDMQQGSHVMQLNQETLTNIREKYDIDVRTLSSIFQHGLPVCKEIK